MRKHTVKCVIENEIPPKFVRHICNKMTAARIHKILTEAGLGREAQAEALDRLIERISGDFS